MVISLSRPYTSANSTGGSASRSSIAHATSWSSCASDADAADGASGPTTPSAAGAMGDKSPGVPAFSHDAAAAAAASDYDAAADAGAFTGIMCSPGRGGRQLSQDVGVSCAPSRPLTAAASGARVSIYAPAAAMKRPTTSSRNGTPASTSARSLKSQSNGSPHPPADVAAAAVELQLQRPTARRAASSHGEHQTLQPPRGFISYVARRRLRLPTRAQRCSSSSGGGGGRGQPPAVIAVGSGGAFALIHCRSFIPCCGGGCSSSSSSSPPVLCANVAAACISIGGPAQQIRGAGQQRGCHRHLRSTASTRSAVKRVTGYGSREIIVSARRWLRGNGVCLR